MSRAPGSNAKVTKSRRKSQAGQPAHVASTARLARRERRREQSREEILSAARQVLLRSGIAATTLEAVAKEGGLSKATLYYYFPSKDALLFELVHGVMEEHAHAVHDRVETTATGAEALRAIVRETLTRYSSRLDDFRLAYLHGQVAGQNAVHFTPEQFARVRPLNDLLFAGAARKLSSDSRRKSVRARVEPRLLAFLAFVSSIGILTMKGMVESLDDPLIYSDEEMLESLSRIFEAAA